MQQITLKSGQKMPMLGMGTWELRGDECTRAVRDALASGYVHVDTAAAYDNHKEVGEALKTAGIERSKLFLTSKVWRDKLKFDDLISECEQALRELGTDYLDLYLVHWPNRDIPMCETFGAMEKLLKDGKIRNAGVSNFTVTRLESLKRETDVPIAVNQVELHPYLAQEKLVDYCQSEDIAVTAYCPLARTKILDDPLLQQLSAKYGKTIAQIALRWNVQRGVIIIPKSVSRRRIQENMDVFDWTLEEEDMRAISALDRNDRICDWDIAEFDR